MILGAVIFSILQLTGVISLSWWWIIAAAILGAIPLAKTVLFIVFKLMGLFAIPVSWWWILLPLAIDVFGIDPFS